VGSYGVGLVITRSRVRFPAMRDRLVLGWVIVCIRAGKPSRYVSSHVGQLSLLSLWDR